MTYFVTGATGFIGKRLVKKLLARRAGVVYFLIRRKVATRCRSYSNTGTPMRRTQCRSSVIWSNRCWEYRRLT